MHKNPGEKYKVKQLDDKDFAKSLKFLSDLEARIQTCWDKAAEESNDDSDDYVELDIGSVSDLLS